MSENDTKERQRIKIVLTGAPTVRVHTDEWPLIAAASYHDFDNQYDFQANRNWRGHVKVRQHADGRALVYARCSHDTVFQGERDYDQKAGELLDVNAQVEDIIAAIQRVHASIDIVDDGHVDQWRLLAAECIADLPARDL